MASLGALTPLVDQYHSIRLVATTMLQEVYHCRPRTRPVRALILTVTTCLLLYVCLGRPSSQPPVDYWSKYPSYHPFHERPEDSPMIVTEGPTLNRNDTLPNNLQKSNPSFHLVLSARQKSVAFCRTLTSAMILNYPPPTVVGYGKELPEGSSDYDYMVARVTDLYKFLAYTPHVQDSDFVLIADEVDVFFQLPPEVLIQRFQNILKENNERLRKKYGLVKLEKPNRNGLDETLQKYSQRVLFGSTKECFPNLNADAGCVTVPQSSLPPDIYGWKTDIHPEGHLTRPRWLKPGAVVGQAADLKLIYAEILRYVEQHHDRHGDYLALTQMYGRQEYLRELERRRSASWLNELLYGLIGISEAANLTGVNPPRLESGRRYEYGIGVDFESRLFFNTFNSQKDIEWLRYNNISKTSSVQAQHGVPRERRLLLPPELDNSTISNPFTQPKFGKDERTNPPYNATLDALPSPQNRSWHNLPLMTNIHSASVPALIHLDEEKLIKHDKDFPVKDTRQLVKDAWWSNMWYQPWARALLRKYMRTPIGFDAAQSALLGGQEWWDLRGGKGGVWTDKGEWLDYSEVCTGFEKEVFDDAFGTWGVEAGDPGEPVYNQFGNLVKGKES